MTESSPSSETKTVAEVWGGIFSWILARLLLIVLLLFPFLLGGFVSGVGLHDPDTCWLLSLGRYIFEHGALPNTDPFSYTFALQPGKPFVMYQWLTELAFFCSYKLGGLSALLMFCALVLGQAFLVFPFRLFAKNGPINMAALLTIAGVVASCFHYLARPEISSYLCMAVCLALLHRIYSIDTKRISWGMVAAVTGLMLIWTNAHSAFVLGLTLQTAFFVISGLQQYVSKVRADGALKTGGVALLGSLLASVLTPYGFGLWSYLPSLFFANFNYRIDELRPISVGDLKEFTYWPFVLICLVSLVLIARAVKAAKSQGFSFPWCNIFVIIVAAYYGFSCRRIIPFSVLMMVSLMGDLWVRNSSETLNQPSLSGTSKRYSLFSNIEKQFSALMKPQSILWPISVAGLSLFGSFFVFTKVAAPSIPQSSSAFVTPVKAIEFLRANPPKGNCFNDAQFGDMLIWYLPTLPVFIDTRYDMHGESLVSDYTTMLRGELHWQPLFERYHVRWVFLPPSTAVLKKLKQDANWKTIFEDKSACIMTRTD